MIAQSYSLHHFRNIFFSLLQLFEDLKISRSRHLASENIWFLRKIFYIRIIFIARYFLHSSPMQVFFVGDSVYPSLHLHLKDPFMLMQCPLVHIPVSWHSS